ncbi:hypothetical protein OHT61_20090 [Streptomyces sp. NBC_00178]|uniref:hypothetical protein n=1 Tax=Streptomyces sp. NBC_00178 TaxID=2975672 RepID=UPI002E2E1854|nr:hypothetical protein [Streptomyces sp. NBC_00178]
MCLQAVGVVGAGEPGSAVDLGAVAVAEQRRPDGYIGWAGEDLRGLAEYAGPLGLDLKSA